ncbi:hypothetical protein [Thiomicrorhabdus sp.]|uniref:hypothetical protein n=1 Tax=Thiomicrorhabdus sp. TaxID=2039724 RepID=UPI002AA8D1C6|nr:hypothetical protein [Thiomicrorhabdus sp.]
MEEKNINHDRKILPKTDDSSKKRKLSWSAVLWVIRIADLIREAIKFIEEGGG